MSRNLRPTTKSRVTMIPATMRVPATARSRGTRCRDVIFETLFDSLWVSNPIRPRSAASRNRVLRAPGVTHPPRSVHREPVGRRDRAPKRIVCEGRSTCVERKAISPHLRGRGGGDRAGVGARGMRAGGFHSEPGRPRRLHRKGLSGGRAPAHDARGRGLQHLASDGAKLQLLGWYFRAQATKRAGWTARSRRVS